MTYEHAKAACHAAHRAAQEADDFFSAAVIAAGYKSRWDWPGVVGGIPASDPVAKAFEAKVEADESYGRACEALRNAKPTIIDDGMGGTYRPGSIIAL